jgi:hypothetical protein
VSLGSNVNRRVSPESFTLECDEITNRLAAGRSTYIYIYGAAGALTDT